MRSQPLIWIFCKTPSNQIDQIRFLVLREVYFTKSKKLFLSLYRRVLILPVSKLQFELIISRGLDWVPVVYQIVDHTSQSPNIGGLGPEPTLGSFSVDLWRVELSTPTYLVGMIAFGRAKCLGHSKVDQLDCLPISTHHDVLRFDIPMHYMLSFVH